MNVDLDALEALLATASARPWHARGRFVSLVPDNSGMGATLHTNHIANFAETSDCTLVAAVVTALPELIAEVRRLTTRVARLEESLDDTCETCDGACPHRKGEA